MACGADGFPRCCRTARVSYVSQFRLSKAGAGEDEEQHSGFRLDIRLFRRGCAELVPQLSIVLSLKRIQTVPVEFFGMVQQPRLLVESFVTVRADMNFGRGPLVVEDFALDKTGSIVATGSHANRLVGQLKDGGSSPTAREMEHVSDMAIKTDDRVWVPCLLAAKRW